MYCLNMDTGLMSAIISKHASTVHMNEVKALSDLVNVSIYYSNFRGL